ncbi:acyl carrier protein [Capnocytophaga sp.]|uniref:acyl carrier protein n=1 Tax=Capnocytophaga sp. TaxID=44737 RepID=UPI0026DDA3CA|nr:phosphopantetheine-binding protein [Capnocytophaga sp.]MDO5106247.1 phosphopantetheine-binding protein [Capnocytophaga sp.]
MNRADIVAITTNILVDEFEVDASVIEPDANFRESLGLDSLDYVDLVVVIEANFGVKLVEADFKPIVTFNDFYATLENKINAK